MYIIGAINSYYENADSKFSNWKLIPLKYLNIFGGDMAYF